jgi:Trm5-related predicted tRNA methylase
MIKIENTVVTISTVRTSRWSKNIALTNIQKIVSKYMMNNILSSNNDYLFEDPNNSI